MVRNVIIRILLLPISLLYGLGVGIINLFHRFQILKAFEFSLPVIAVGNLSVGGAGKSPHTEYLIRLLRENIRLATMSRGYGRNTKGFLIAGENHSAYEIGDEPLQFKRKFDDVVVTVAEERAMGIPKLLSKHPEIETILLDDAFQHRSVKPGLNLLLTEYQSPYFRDFLMPSGRLREWPSGAKRADAIIVSKCPPELSRSAMEDFEKKLQPEKRQKVFFSKFEYLTPYNVFNPVDKRPLDAANTVLAVSAIARSDEMIEYLENRGLDVYDLSYEDHHKFSNHEISRMLKQFQQLPGQKKMLLTTEKDAARMELHKAYFLEHDTQLYALPVRVAFLPYKDDFDDYVRDFLLNFKV